MEEQPIWKEHFDKLIEDRKKYNIDKREWKITSWLHKEYVLKALKDTQTDVIETAISIIDSYIIPAPVNPEELFSIFKEHFKKELLKLQEEPNEIRRKILF